jgi:hypothetical protein
VAPSTVTLASDTERTAPPLNRPAGFALRTIPVTRAPLGIAILPSTSIGEETVAEKFCPVEEILEPIDSSRTTVMVVSAGTTTGFGAIASRTPEFLEGFEPFVGPPEELLAAVLEESLDAVSGVAD